MRLKGRPCWCCLIIQEKCFSGHVVWFGLVRARLLVVRFRWSINLYICGRYEVTREGWRGGGLHMYT